MGVGVGGGRQEGLKCSMPGRGSRPGPAFLKHEVPMGVPAEDCSVACSQLLGIKNKHQNHVSRVDAAGYKLKPLEGTRFSSPSQKDDNMC